MRKTISKELDILFGTPTINGKQVTINNWLFQTKYINISKISKRLDLLFGTPDHNWESLVWHQRCKFSLTLVKSFIIQSLSQTNSNFVHAQNINQEEILLPKAKALWIVDAQNKQHIVTLGIFQGWYMDREQKSVENEWWF